MGGLKRKNKKSIKKRGSWFS